MTPKQAIRQAGRCTVWIGGAHDCIPLNISKRQARALVDNPDQFAIHIDAAMPRNVNIWSGGGLADVIVFDDEGRTGYENGIRIYHDPKGG